MTVEKTISVKSLAFTKPYSAGESATSHVSLTSSTIEISSLPTSRIVIKYLAAPVNPVDLLVLAGKYPVKPRFHTPSDASIAGFDGAAEVTHIGSSVTSVSVGDKVLPRVHGLGTWRTHAVLDEKDVVVLPNDVDPKFASLVKMGFAPGFFLLEDVRRLNPGEWIIMNAGNSVIAQSMAQFARIRGVKTILVVRDREQSQIDQLKKNSGATIVVTESQMNETTKPLKDNTVLAIDCVFGKSGHNLVRNLSAGGTYVVMGFMSRNDPNNKDPVGDFKLDETNIFYKAIEFKNFRLSKCLEKRSADNIADMMAWFCELYTEGILRLPEVEINEWKASTTEKELLDVISKAEKNDVGGKKQVFSFV